MTSPYATSRISTSARLCPALNTYVLHVNKSLVTKDVVYFQVNKGMYDLKQAGLLANDRIVEHLAKYDYVQSK